MPIVITNSETCTTAVTVASKGRGILELLYLGDGFAWEETEG